MPIRRIAAPGELFARAYQHPLAPAFLSLALAGIILAIAGFLIWRNWRHNEPGLSKPLAFGAAVTIFAATLFAATYLAPHTSLALLATAAVAGLFMIGIADHRRYVRDPAGHIVFDRWRIVLRLGGQRWTQDKACRHFFITGDTGSGKTSGLDRLLYGLFEHNPAFGGVIMANKGSEWHSLQKIGARFGREADLIRLRPRATDENEQAAPVHRLNLTGDLRFPPLTRARILVDTAAALNPKEEKSFFKNKGSIHIARTLELLEIIGRRPTPTNCYQLLTSHVELQAALKQLSKPSDRAIKLADHFQNSILKHTSLDQQAGEVGTSQNYLEYLGTPAIAEVFSSEQQDTCSIADVDRGKILCVDVPQDYTTERQYIFTVMKLLLYRHALRRYQLPPHERYAQNLLVLVGDEFQNVITASFDGTSDFNVVDRLRDCLLMLIVSAQAFESLVPPQTREQANVFALNLRNLVMFRAASEEDARRCAEVLGKREVRRTTTTIHADYTSYSYATVEEYCVKPQTFRRLPDHMAYVKHCTNGYRRVRLPPLSLA